MTPCEQLGYKVGDRFRMIAEDSPSVKKGTIVELAKDDGTHVPFFKVIDGEVSDVLKVFHIGEGDKVAVWLHELEPYGDDHDTM